MTKYKDIHFNILNFFNKFVTYKLLFILGIILSIIGSFAELSFPIIISSLVEPKVLRFILNNYIIIILGIVFFILIYSLQGISTYIIGKVGANTIKNIQNEFSSHVFSLPLHDFDNSQAGDLSSRLTNDISEAAKIITILLPQLITILLPQLIISTIIIIGSLCFLLTINIRLTLIFLAIVPVLFIVTKPLNKKLEYLFNLHQYYLGNISGKFSQKIKNIKIIKVFNGNEEENSFFNSLFYKLFNNLTDIIYNSSILNVIVSSLLTVFIAFILITASWQVNNNYISFRMMITFILYIVQIINPLLSIINDVSELFKSKGALTRISEILTLPLEKSETGNEKITISNGSILFNNVSFSYSKNKLILKEINFHVPNKSFVAIVGPSGIGKTTIFSLIMKLYTNYSGTIKIDRDSLRNIKATEVRQKISCVFQNDFLFSGTIRDNLKYGKNENVTDNELKRILKVTGSYKFIFDLNEGLDSIIGENGVGLSEGQKQRISIARALIGNPKILLLDEITSNLDAANELKIIKILKKISKNTTVIMIAHRQRVIKEATKVYALNGKGKMISYRNGKEYLNKITKK